MEMYTSEGDFFLQVIVELDFFYNAIDHIGSF